MRRAQPSVPYKLSAVGREICALGPERVLSELETMPEAEWRQHPQGRYVAFAANRWTFMAAEALAAPAFVSPEYAELRAGVMSPPPSDVYRWRAVAPRLSRPLMRHQEEFCAMAYPRRGTMNASEQGTGKTATACALIGAWNMWRTLVVVPKSIMWQWSDEFSLTVDNSAIDVMVLDRYTVKERAAILTSVEMHDKRLCVILNYEVLAEMKGVLTHEWEPNVVVFDESWRLKSHRTHVTKAATAVADQCDHALLLTGTPVGQDIGDLWSQLRILSDDRGADMPDYGDFMCRYARFVSYNVGARQVVKATGAQEVGRLMQYIEPMYYRATKATCLDLPEKLPVERVRLDLTPAVRRLYDDVKEHGEAALGGGLSLMGARATKIRLQQIAGGFCFNPDGSREEEWERAAVAASAEHGGSLTEDGDLKLRMVGSPKMDWLLEFARDQLAGDPTTRAIVWYKFNAEGAWNCSRMSTVLGEGRCAFVNKDTSTREFERIKESFNSRDPDGVQVIHAQVKKVAYGHNLQAADVSVWYSHTWSYIEKAQAGDRNHRIGRTAPVRTIELVARKTVDEEVLDATDNLRDVSDRLTPDTTTKGETDAEDFTEVHG